jgi:16S rRNA processing protein RimM
MAAQWDEMAAVGRVARAHGIRGLMIINPETDFPHERFRPGAEVFLARGERVEKMVISSARFQQDRPVIGFRGIEDMTTAQQLAGAELRVPVAWLPVLPSGTFYRHDLVGCEVETRNERRLGVVRDVEGTMGGSRLVVETAGGELLIPLAAEICTTIDPERKRIIVEPPEGLLELNEVSKGKSLIPNP